MPCYLIREDRLCLAQYCSLLAAACGGSTGSTRRGGQGRPPYIDFRVVRDTRISQVYRASAGLVAVAFTNGPGGHAEPRQ